jgi:hypothetical protein
MQVFKSKTNNNEKAKARMTKASTQKNKEKLSYEEGGIRAG